MHPPLFTKDIIYNTELYLPLLQKLRNKVPQAVPRQMKDLVPNPLLQAANLLLIRRLPKKQRKLKRSQKMKRRSKKWKIQKLTRKILLQTSSDSWLACFFTLRLENKLEYVYWNVVVLSFAGIIFVSFCGLWLWINDVIHQPSSSSFPAGIARKKGLEKAWGGPSRDLLQRQKKACCLALKGLFG